MTLSLLFYSLFPPFSKMSTTVLTRKDRGIGFSLFLKEMLLMRTGIHGVGALTDGIYHTKIIHS